LSAELTKNALFQTVFFGDFANWEHALGYIYHTESKKYIQEISGIDIPSGKLKPLISAATYISSHGYYYCLKQFNI